MSSWYRIRAQAHGAEVMIYDEIGAHGISAKAFLDELGEIPDPSPIDIRLNSPGGSVFDAVAIFNAIKRHAGPVTVWIDGIAASAASYIAMAGDEVVMPQNAFIMIHDPSGLAIGTAEDMRAMAEALDKIKTSLVSGYVSKSGRTEDEVAALMAKETWLDAAEAVRLGFADRLIEPVRIAASFDLARFRNPPVMVAIGGDDETAGENVVGDDNNDKVGGDASAGIPNTPAPDPVIEDIAQNPASDDPASTSMIATVDPAAVRAQALAHARAVFDLCRLAGLADRAGGFIESGASLDEVRVGLIDARAVTAEDEPAIDPHHPQPGRRSTARPWAEVIARVFRVPHQQKG